MSEAERECAGWTRIREEGDRRDGHAEPSARLRLVSDRTARWEWESGERRWGLSPRYRLDRVRPRPKQ
jgi:hypothetical protein